MQVLDRKWVFGFRRSIARYERSAGLYHLSRNAKELHSYITVTNDVTIASITKDPYFSTLSLSTVKRAVIELIDEEKIIATQSDKDKRQMILSIT
jgi:hypothetical protein